MPEESKTPSIVRFSSFELSTDTGELRKNGIRKKLFGQPIKVLTLLVATPGQLVTREQLQQALWPRDTYTDFDRGLNAAISKLRENLEDSATEPTYIQTVPGRGYRFIGKIEPDESKPSRSDIDPSKAGMGTLQNYTLIAFVPHASALERAAEVVVWVRHEVSEELFEPRPTRLQSPDLAGTFCQRPFSLKLILNESGTPQPTDIILRLDAPNYAPSSQVKKLTVPYGADSSSCTFLITPRFPGELIANLELLDMSEKLLASRSIRTRTVPVSDWFSPTFSFTPLKLIYEELRQESRHASAIEEPTFERESSATALTAQSSDAPIAVLKAETGELSRGQSFTLTESMTGVSIGRSRECEICVPHTHVSRLHSKLVIEPVYQETQGPIRYTFTLIDCGSRLGTKLNGEPVIRATLRHGDRIQVGAVRFKFAVLDGALVTNPSAGTDLGIETALSSRAEQQVRVLEAAAPKEATVGCSIEVIAMVREGNSEGGLRALVALEKVAGLNEGDVRERPFEVEFPLDADGKPLPLSISLRLESPGFEPASQIKKLRVPPSGNSPACTFVVISRLAGEHVMNIELLDPQEQVLVSRSIRTRALPSGAESSSAKTLVTIPLVVVIRGPGVRDGESGSAPDEVSLLDQALEGDTAAFEVPRMKAKASESAPSDTEETRDFRVDFLETFQTIPPPESEQASTCGFGEVPKAGMVISHYRLIEVIGQGGMGAVFKAEDLTTGRLVAIKLHPRSAFVGTPDPKYSVEEVTSGGVVQGSEPVPHGPRRRRWLLIGTGVLTVLLCVATFTFHRGLTSSKGVGTIVLADFPNSTGDPAFDNLDLGLSQSPGTNILSKARVNSILQQMNRRPDVPLTPELAREVCVRANCKAVLLGSVAVDGNRYRIEMRATDCHTGETLAYAEGTADKGADVPGIVREETNQLVGRLSGVKQ
jgi:DNA-binding winged helix-turn-helix (wHTH) protein/pSer/pThr/pTyr-binding forkhead associated (FHA) protein